METWKDCVRGLLANLVQVEGESLMRYFKRTRQLCSDRDVYGDGDMGWVVKGFIYGLIDDELQSAMRAARRRNQSMTLGQAYCWVLVSSLAPQKVPGRYPGAGSLPGGHCVVVMRAMSLL